MTPEMAIPTRRATWDRRITETVWDWLMSVQDMLLGGGLTPSQYKETVLINELAEDGVSILNSWTCTGVWPCKVNGQDLDRMSSDNTLEDLEFSVDTCEKL